MNNTTTQPKILRVLAGNRRIGFRKHQRLSVLSVEPMGADYGHMVRVRVRHGNTSRLLWARHINRLGDVSFNLGNGTGVDRIRVSVVR